MSNIRAKTVAGSTDSKPSLMDHVMLSLLLLGIFLAPYAKGLFHSTHLAFEKNINFFLLAGSVFLFYAAYILFQKAKTGTHWIAYAIWLIPCSFMLSSITPISRHASMYAVMLYMIYAAFFVVGAHLFQKFESLLVYALLGTGYAISLFGLLHWFGLHLYEDAVLNNRLSSVFQYANTNAIFIIVLLLGSLYLLTYTEKKVRLSSILVSLMAVPLAFSFFVTESRGALIAFPVVLLIVLWLLPMVKQIMFSIYFAVAAGIALAVYPSLKAIGISLQREFDLAKSLHGWLVLIAVSFAYAGFHVLFQRVEVPFLQAKLGSVRDRVSVRSILPGLFFTIGALLIVAIVQFGDRLTFLPTYLQNQIARINLQENSILERFAFFRDAFKMFLDDPFFGAGGGAWAEGYQSYQSNPYISNETHNYYAQYLLETGIFGSLIFILIIGYVIVAFIRKALRTDQRLNAMVLTIIVLGVLIHSFVDFNMSFAYIASLVFLALGGMSTVITDDNQLLPAWFRRLKITTILPAALALGSIVFLFVSARFVQSHQIFNAVQEQLSASTTVNFHEVNHQFAAASKLHPTQPYYQLAHTSFLLQVYLQFSDPVYVEQALDLSERLRKREPYNTVNLMQYVHGLSLAGDYRKTFQSSLEALKQFPWIVFFYEQALITADLLMQSSDPAEQETLRDQIKWILERIERQQAIQDSVPEGQKKGTPFVISPEILELASSHLDP